MIDRSPSLYLASGEAKVSSLSKEIVAIAREFSFPACAKRDHHRNLRGRKRKLLIRRYEKRCALCGRLESPSIRLQLHHIGPWSEGGPSDENNLIPLCSDTCHPFADLGVWTRSYLWELSNAPAAFLPWKCASPVTEEGFREQLLHIRNSSSPWQKRIEHLLLLWGRLSRSHHMLIHRRVELWARIAWDISAILTTYGPAGDSVLWRQRNLRVPLNRFIGINLGCKARAAVNRILSNMNPFVERELHFGISHSIGVHLRSVGYHQKALADFTHNCRELLTYPEHAIPDPSWRAYLLTAHCTDLVRAHPFNGVSSRSKRSQQLAEKAVRWVADGDSEHSYLDTRLREIEVQIYSDNCHSGLKHLAQIWDSLDYAEPILKVIGLKLRLVALLRVDALKDAENAYREAKVLAEKEQLADQVRKLDSLWAGLRG